MRNTLLESLNKKVGSTLVSRRYNLSDMISESYRMLYNCEKGTNLHRLAESHLNDVRRNPTDIDRLSRQLSLMKELSRMVESNEISDKDLKASTESKINGHLKEETLGKGRFQIVNKDGEVIDTYTAKKDADDWVEQLYKDNEFKRGDLKVVDTRNNESRRFRGRRLKESWEQEGEHEWYYEKDGKYGYVCDTEDGDDYYASVTDHTYGKIYIDSDGFDSPEEAKSWVEHNLDKVKESTEENPDKDEDLLEDTELTEEEVDELEKHLAEIRKNKKSGVKECGDPKKKSLDESIPTDKDFVDKHDNPKNYRANTAGFDKAYEILNKYGSPDEDVDKVFNRMSDEDKTKAYNLICGTMDECGDPKKTPEGKRVKESLKWDHKFYVGEGNTEETTVPVNLHFSIWHSGEDSYNVDITDQSGNIIDLPFGRQPYSSIEEAQRAVESFVSGRMEESKKNPKGKRVAESYRGLSNFKEQSKSKAFYKTFKKMHESLKSGRALTRQESINLYKAANSALTQMSIELEHNPKFLKAFNESSTLLAADVNSLRESLARGKGPSKKTMKSLAKFSESLLNEETHPEGKDDKLHVTIKDGGTRVDYFDTTADEIFDDMKGFEDEKGKTATVSGPGWSCSWEDYVKDKSVNEAKDDEEDEDLEDIEEEPTEEDIPEEEPADDDFVDYAEDDEFIGDDEGDIDHEPSEEEESYDQEYADGRSELHDELADEYEETEDTYVQDKLEQDRVEVAVLNGEDPEEEAEEDLVDEPTDDPEDGEEVEEPAEEEPLDDEDLDDSDITDDELAELKSHLKEMRKARKIKESLKGKRK